VTDVIDPGAIGRRKLLQVSGFAAAAAACSNLVPTRGGQKELQDSARRSEPTASFAADVDISLRASAKQVGILPGNPTACWAFDGDVLHGDANTLEMPAPSTYLGPTIRVKRGQKVRIRFTSGIPEPSIVHWHGLHVPAEMDGHPRYAISQGQTFTYEFEIRNRPGTYWYHAHPDRVTGAQVYRGLAGLFIVNDAEEDALALPRGAFDVPLVVQDRLFDGDNQLLYSNRGMQLMTGMLGNRILVNGRPDFALRVSTRAYRVRLLNGSNSRIYKLAFRDGTPLVVIGTDGGLLERPVSRPSLLLGPAERVELWVDFSERSVGSRADLVSLPFDYPGTPAMGMGPGAAQGAPPNGSAFNLVRFEIDRKEPEPLRLPDRLLDERPFGLPDAADAEHPRDFPLFMNRMRWTIAGRTFQMTEAAPNERIRLGSVAAVRFRNESGGMGMMMRMAHPMHIHGGQFRVVDRRGPTVDGLLDLGWKDTVLVMPDQQVTLVMPFQDYEGLFLYHCHNLEHEDQGMMRNFLVGA